MGVILVVGVIATASATANQTAVMAVLGVGVMDVTDNIK